MSTEVNYTTYQYKLKQVVIQNVKNVSYGEINFTNKGAFLNTIGIYGANGSGKTTFVDALTIIKQIIEAGLVFSDARYHEMVDLIEFDQPSPARISIVLTTDSEDVTYEVALNRDENRLFIEEERVSYRAHTKGARNKTLLHYQKGSVFSSAIDLPLLELTKVFQKRIEVPEKQIKLGVLSEVTQERGDSFLFNKRMVKVLAEEQLFPDELQFAQKLFKAFAVNLYIYSSKVSGRIYSDISLPLSFSVDHEFGMTDIPTDGRHNVAPEVYRIGQKVFEQLNQVLPTLIPNLRISLDKKDTLVNAQQQEVYTVELMAHRGERQFPLRCESDGIKKLISILSTLINTYNTPFAIAVIDELDAGIYEYLLGEIVAVMATNAKGLLIFTSHNLRPLEVLDYKKIIFTTTNPNNRYITIKNIKPTNNLRDTYIRAIQLGGMAEPVFKEVNQAKIKRAFRKAQKVEREMTDGSNVTDG